VLSRLQPGQTLEARILDNLAEGKWAIRLLGQDLVAESRLSLVPGQLMQARIQSLGPPVVLTLFGLTGSESASIARALQDLALADDGLNRAIVRGMIGRGIGVTREGLLALREALLGLGQGFDLSNPESLEQIVARALLLQSRGLPVTPDSIQAYLGALPAGALGGLMEGLVGILRSLRLPGFDRQEADALADRIRAALPSLDGLSGDALRELVARLGTDLEGRLASWVLSGQSGIPGDAADTLKLALLQLQARLQGLDPGSGDAEGRSQLDALLERVGEAVRFLDTQQAVNLPSSDRQAIHLQVPFFVDGRIATADLLLEPHGGNGSRKLSADSFGLTLSVELSGLGPVRMSLSAVDRQAVCTFYVTDERRAEFIQEHLEELRSALETCGYAVSGISCRLREPEEETDGSARSIGLDIRA
jgi:hypothetical protein